jgi:hypothetical protein
MIRFAIAGLALAVAASAQAMPRAALPQPDSLITQVREGCGVGMIRLNGMCVARSTLRQARRGYYGDNAYGYGAYGNGYYGNRGFGFGFGDYGSYGGGDYAAVGSGGRLSYEQAWARCKAFVDVLPRDAQSQRYSRGSACMHQYGYRL